MDGRFRTHDLGRWNANGDLEILGRADDVVKVSGQSVELGEIERTLLRHPGVGRAAVVQLQGRLVACVELPSPDQAQGVDWREFLGRTLPSYMIPAEVVTLTEMPINSAGKVDRAALSEIAKSRVKASREQEEGAAPRGDLEQAIARIWEEVLDFRPIFREDNFFAVGGTSLASITVSQRLLELGYNVPVRMVLASLTVEALAARIAEMREQPADPAGETDAPDLATMDQEGFWIASEIGLAPAASHVVRVLCVRGRIPDAETWQSAWLRLIERHAALRTAFHSDENGRLRWRTAETNDIGPSANFSFDKCASIEVARDLVAIRTNERFDLSKPPLVRAGLIAVEEGGETLFWFVLHHAIADGISTRTIQEEIHDLIGGRSLPPAPNGVALAGRAEQQYLSSDRAEHDREFWQNRLAVLVERGGEAFEDYITERPRPAMATGRGSAPLSERLDARTLESLGRLAKAHRVGLHALLLAILASETRRRVGRGDVIVGSGISVRPAGGETAIGHFVNVLPVILEKGSGDAPFSALLREAQAALTETVEHAAYPANRLYREFRHRHPEHRAGSRTSLFDIALTAIPPRYSEDREAGIVLEPRPMPGELVHPAAGLDLSFSHERCAEDEGGLNLLLTWNADVCTKPTAEAWLSSFAAWARWLAEDPARFEKPLPTLLPDEAARIERWERGPVRPRPNRRCHEIFERLADRQPQSPAVVTRERVETFEQLDARANGIAQRLTDRGVSRGAVVAVLTSGPTDLPATVLGIWKTGGAYLPLAQDQPPARLADMAADAGAKILFVLDGLEVPTPLANAVTAVIRPRIVLRPAGVFARRVLPRTLPILFIPRARRAGLRACP